MTSKGGNKHSDKGKENINLDALAQGPEIFVSLKEGSFYDKYQVGDILG
jgi:hypothetical protein